MAASNWERKFSVGTRYSEEEVEVERPAAPSMNIIRGGAIRDLMPEVLDRYRTNVRSRSHRRSIRRRPWEAMD